MWLRILSIAFEKELNVLDSANDYIIIISKVIDEARIQVVKVPVASE